MRNFSNIIVTGGAGFIGSNMIRYLLSDKSGFNGKIINLDKLTYAGNLSNLEDISVLNKDRYFFEKADICDLENNIKLLKKHDADAIIHFATESHVDRSIKEPGEFIQTNVIGTYCLLEACRIVWKDKSHVLFHHVSTDEVYGSLDATGCFNEESRYNPRSPYSASKAGSDHLVMAYHYTYGLPITLTNCSNNYGPFQYPEKLIPFMISNMINGKPLTIYGDGKNVRDWLYVEDHNSAVWAVMQNGKTGEGYNIGGENEWENISLVKKLCAIVSKLGNIPESELLKLITLIDDRPGHDRRYAVDCSKLKSELGWNQSMTFEMGLEKTVKWYLDNEAWVKDIESGGYLNRLNRN